MFKNSFAVKIAMSTQHDRAQGALLMTVSEVATTFGVKPRTIDRWLDNDLIPKPLHVGGATRFRRADIEGMIEAGSMAAFQRAKRLQRKS